jgi:exonuclease III
MLAYTPDQLRAFNRDDHPPPARNVRKAIFSLRIWRPRGQQLDGQPLSGIRSDTDSATTADGDEDQHDMRDLPVGPGDPDPPPTRRRARLHTRLATLNTRTLKAVWRQEEAAALVTDLGLDALAIQEHREFFAEPSREKDLGAGIVMVQSPADQHGVGGVGLIVSRSFFAQANITVVDSCIITASIPLRRRKLHLVCAYAPTASKTAVSPTDTIDFYDRLESIINSYPLRDITMLLGDMNATLVERSQLVRFPVGRENCNSKHFTNLLDRCNLVPLNANFPQKPKRQITFDGMQGRKTRLDYICCNTPARRHFVSCRTVRMLTIKSDHRMVVASLRESLPFVLKRAPADPRPNWTDLKDPTKMDAFATKTRQVFDAQDCPSSSFSSLVQAVNVAARETLSEVHRRPHTKAPWESDPAVLEARERVKTLRRAAYATGSSDAHDVANEAALYLSNMYCAARKKHVEAIVHTVENEWDTGRTRAAWKAIAELTGPSKKTRVKASKADLAAHFQTLLSAPSPDAEALATPPSLSSSLLDIDTMPITLKELRTAMQDVPLFKATGSDGIPTAAYSSSIAPLLLDVMNGVLAGGPAPPEWLESEIVPIYKKGAANDPANYRGISLMQTAAKLFDRILLLRIREQVSTKLLNFQNGFRPSRGTTEHVLALRTIIDACRSRKKNVVIIFVDFAKAFDSVSRPAMAKILTMYGVPESITRAILALYDGTRARVRTEDGATDLFDTTAGVLQGDTLAPFLFVLILDFVLRTAFPDNTDFFEWRPRQGTRTRTTRAALYVGILAFADDLALLAPDAAAAQRLIDRLTSAAALVGLHINAKKTEVLATPALPDEVAPIQLADVVFKNVDSFTYLGIDVADSGRALKARRAKAWGAAWRLHSLFHSDAEPQLKTRIFRATVEQVLLYGVEALTLTETLSRTLDANYDALLRFALGIHHPTHITTNDLRALTRTPSCHVMATARRLRLVGHLVRHQGEQPAADVINYVPTEPWRKGGWSRKTWRSTLEADLEKHGLSLHDAYDRHRWQNITRT